MPVPPRVRDAALFGGLVLVYFAAGKLGLALAFVNQSASAVWPPTGIALAAALLLGPRIAGPAVFAGAFLVNITTTGDLPTSLAIALGNMLEALVGAWLAQRLAGGRAAFGSAQGALGFAAAVVLSTVLSATIGATSLLLGGLAAPTTLGAVWFTWWLGDLVGGLVVAPLVLVWAERQGRPLRAARVAEAAVLGATLLALSGLVFGGLARVSSHPISFLALPPLVWAAFRFGPRGAATAIAVLSAVAIAGTLRGGGPFSALPPESSLLLLQSFIGVATLTSLVLAALVGERARVEAELRAARDEMERRVVERTASLTGALEALRRSEALLADAERIANVGSWDWDIPSDRVAWSRELYRIYGVDPVTFPATYHSFLDRVHPEDKARVDGIVRHAYESGEPFDYEHRIVRPGGEVRLIHARGAVFRDEQGKPVRMAGTGQDVTVQREAAAALEQLKELERLREMDRFKTHFLNVAAHELSTPITPIQLQLALLRDSGTDPLTPAQQRSVAVLERNVLRLAALVRDILEAARLQAGRLTIRPRPCDLRNLVLEAVETFQAPAGNGRLEVRVEAAEEVPVEADPARLHQVLLNLLTNAWKFTPAGGRITVAVLQEGREAVVRVTDTGLGVRAEDMPKLFEPFSQVHEPAGAKAEGTGLGLFISRGIVEAHGGRMWCESEGRNKGATFAFALPLSAVELRTRA